MSGMSKGAFAEITSLRNTEERVFHLNNILKFAVFKKDRSLFAIGGPWNAAIDGGDPSVDCSCLIRTAIRCVKELVQVDLSNCTHWNRFVEVHYNRIGKDGLFSHKEITVLFVPNLLECLPSVDIWKNNWIAYKKSKAEREQLTMKKEKSPGESKEQKQGELNKGKSIDGGLLKEGDVGTSDTKNDKVDADMDQKDMDVEGKVDKVEEPTEKMGGDVEAKTTEGSSVGHAAGDKKPIKKKVIKKVMKVVRKKPTAGASADKSCTEDKNVAAESASKTAEGGQSQLISEDAGKEQEGAGSNQQPEAKKTGKKRIIRRVVKRKVSASGSQLTAPATPAETSKKEAEVQPEKNVESSTDAGNSQTKLQEGSKTSAEDVSSQKDQKEEEKPEEKEHTLTDGRSPNGDKANHKEAVEQKDMKKDGKKEKTKDDKEKKNRDIKVDPKLKPLNDLKEKKKSDEPPKYPGFILQAKRSKESKLRSTSLSLDGLLDYTAKDIEESVFELSLFAESFSEMLQHRMGCVILSFLEKLSKRYVLKRNQRKRQREEDLKKEEKKSLEKRPKTAHETITESADGDVKMTKEGEEKMSTDHSASVHDEQSKVGQVKLGTDHPVANHDKPAKEGVEKMNTEHSEAAANEAEAGTKMDEEDPEYEEDPEEIEIYEDDEDMDDAHAEEPTAELNEDDREAKPEVAAEDSGNNKIMKEPELENVANIHDKAASVEEKQSIAEKGDSVEGGEKVVSKEVKPAKDEVVDKELLQAFRYFDQNRAGYLKLDDLRCILHNLGKFLSSKDVKDLVQIALIESNSARDNRIIYPKLVKIVDL